MEYALVFLWLLVYYALAFVGLPIASAVFARFPGRGAAFSLPLSFGFVTLLTYWLGQVAFGTATIAAAIVVLAVVSALLIRRGLESDRRAYVEAMAVFTVAFLFLVAVRAVDPAIEATGGEKFLDFGLLKSIVRATALPPQDVWFAGEHVAYYYGGHLLAAVLTKLTGTAPRFGYNLALAGFYGTFVTTAYGLAGTVAAKRGVSFRRAGVFAAFFVGFASNLFTAMRLLAWLFPRGLVEAIAKPLDMTPAEVALEPMAFGYWDASRVIPGTITEFPFFAYLNGDLHAHMTVQPFLLLVAAVGYAVYRADGARRRLLVFGALPPVVALVGIVSFWCFPTALGVVCLALTFAPSHPLTLVPGVSYGEGRTGWVGGEVGRTATAMVVTVLVGALALLWSAPFVFNVLLEASGSRSVGFFPDRSSLVGLFAVHGAFLLVFALYLGSRFRSRGADAAPTGVFGAFLVFLGWQGNLAALVLVAPLLVAGWYLLRTDETAGFETVLLVAGAGLVLLVEFVYVNDNAGPGRYNTVFKVYMQVWALWGTAAGAALARLLADAGGDRPLFGRSMSRRRVMSVFTAGLVFSTSIYGGFALAEHSAGHRAADPTLDGKAFVSTFHGDEAAAIEWLDGREGQPHIVSAPGDAYRWSSPGASLTGLPTVLGWPQERIYRGEPAYEERAEDVELIYTADWETRLRLLDEYDVKYVYYGPQEREAYGRANFAGHPAFERVHRSGDVSIYRVDPAALDGTERG